MTFAMPIENLLCNPQDELLSWFAKSGAPMNESVFRLGALSYFQFSSSFKTNTVRHCGAFGRSQDRKMAAIKCVAEFVERKAMMDFFSDRGNDLLPASFHTSNGWAVHFERAEAQKRSYLEALERHLLLLSYLKFGWNGFRLIQKIESSELDLYFLLSRFSAEGFISGLVAAKSPLYPGVSFGYCIGKEADTQKATFWESALFESIDRILTLNGEKIDLSTDPNSWLKKEAKAYLETPFDFSCLQNGFSKSIAIKRPQYSTRTFNVADWYGIPNSFYAAFSWGEDLIPIFHKAALDTTATNYLRTIFERNGLSIEIPERHPVL